MTRNRWPYLCTAAVALVSAVHIGSALALDAVNIRLEGIGNEERRDALLERLRGASLTADIVDDEEIDEPPVQDLLGLAQADYARLVSILYSAGYYGPSVSIRLDGNEAADIDPFRVPSSVRQIDITVQSGPRFRFGRANVSPRPQTVPPGPIVEGFETGEVAESDLIGSAANTGVREWREVGHPKADVAGQSVQAVHPDRRLDVDIDLAPGPLLRFGPLTVRGRSDVREERVRQIMGYPEGEIYSPQELRDAVNRLRRTGAFSSVVVEEADVPNPDGTLNYALTLVDEKKRRFGFSAEYGTLDGIALSGFWLHRNLFGGAERFRVDGQISNIGGTAEGFSDAGGVDYSLGFRLTRPGSFGADNDLFVYGRYDHTDDPDYVEDEFTLGVGVSRYFSDDLYGEIAGGLRYSYVDDDFGEREFYHVIFPGSLEWDKRDNEGDPLSGFYSNSKVTPYVGVNGSQSGVYGDFDLRGYFSPGVSDRLTFAGRAQIGTVVGSELEETPPDFLFFSGGGDTVRGQEYQSLGVTLDDGRKTGGRSFLGMSLEARYRAGGSLGVVVFSDIGYVGPESYIDDQAEMQAGAGLGVRYATPIGPLRVDLATPVAGDGGTFNRVDLYIGVGQAF